MTPQLTTKTYIMCIANTIMVDDFETEEYYFKGRVYEDELLLFYKDKFRIATPQEVYEHLKKR